MEYSTDPETISKWAPLLTEVRGDVPIAATMMDSGTDVNFGNISRKLLTWLEKQPGCGIATEVAPPNGARVLLMKRAGRKGDLTPINDHENETKKKTPDRRVQSPNCF